MKRNWQVQTLNVQFAQKRCDVGLTDGALYVNVSFPFDPKGDQKESEVQRRALAQAKALFAEAADANVHPID
ncbi:hypothetical protein [Brevundimonas vesicularis]|uniref:Uncharacterized protein n=1 Tax=Brevundimonas vesicularis TaxID=41276 RepID=A0A1Z3U778_BREVE|nr:hypothetical protein [Brevundimonas vesicularis]ASE39156.1 hypothetical protein CEP68_06370 [Brevundimonas vesicularis]